MPSIAYGTWTLGNGQGVVDQVEQALNVGFSHIGKSLFAYLIYLMLMVRVTVGIGVAMIM